MAYKLNNDGNFEADIFNTYYYYYFKLCTRVILSAILFALGITAFAMIAIAPPVAIGGLIITGIICSMVGASSLFSSLKELWRNIKSVDLFKGCDLKINCEDGREGKRQPFDPLSEFVRGAVFIDYSNGGRIVHGGIAYGDDSIIASPGSSTRSDSESSFSPASQ